MECEGKPGSSARRSSDLSRRELLVASAAIVATAPLASCTKEKAHSSAPKPAKSPGLVRVVSVPTAVEGNLLPMLVADFEKQSSYKVELSSNDDVYGEAHR